MNKTANGFLYKKVLSAGVHRFFFIVDNSVTTSGTYERDSMLAIDAKQVAGPTDLLDVNFIDLSTAPTALFVKINLIKDNNDSQYETISNYL